MAVKRLYEREYGLEILVGDPQVQLGDDTILDILDGYLRGGGETGGIENGKLRIENFLLGREEFLQGSQQGYYTQDPSGIDGDTGDGASHGTSIGVTGVGE